jgi:Ca-activated chloride channel family protein
MRIRSGLIAAVAPWLAAAALATATLTALPGCDDHDKKAAKEEKAEAAENSPGRLGVGWRSVEDAHQSVWGFNDRPVPIPGHLLASQTNAPEATRAEAQADALAKIRTALLANMLPARGSIRIEELVNRSVASMEPATAAGNPNVLIATTPWNDDTVLLWVDVPGADARTVTIEFDPAWIAAFRPLGNPGALPQPDEAGQVSRAAMLYELVPRPNAHYGTLHVVVRGPAAQRTDRQITPADSVGAIDNAPDVVRLATAAAGFGELLRGDPAVGDLSCNDVIALAQSIRQPDLDGWRAQLVALMYRAQPLIDLPARDDAGK